MIAADMPPQGVQESAGDGLGPEGVGQAALVQTESSGQIYRPSDSLTSNPTARAVAPGSHGQS